MNRTTKNVAAWMVCLAGVVGTAGLVAAASGAPGQPAAAREDRDVAGAFLEMINDPTPARVTAFETRFASKARLSRATMEERVQRMQALHADWGVVALQKVVAPGAAHPAVRATSARAGLLELTFEMSATEAGKLDGIAIETGDALDAPALTPEARTHTVERVAEILRTKYVFPEIGAKMAETVLANAAAGKYDALADAKALSRRLMDDCLAISHDKHLGVRFVPGQAPQQHVSTAPPEDRAAEMRRENYMFRKVEVLPGNIGYLRFDNFWEEDEAKEIASASMAFLRHCDALVVDLRFNGGGSPEMIRYLTSYLFNSRTHLNDMVDRDGKVVEEYWTLDAAPGPGPRHDVPVYVLTSGRTFSGAEEFSYNLKNLKRATLVGETTGGGAHPVRGERATDQVMVRVPFMRARNPISGTNWEGTGVSPDVSVPSGEALDKALELIRAAK